MIFPLSIRFCGVIHRIGGLETTRLQHSCKNFVIHRIGGLETKKSAPTLSPFVIHRIGGLEINILVKIF